MHAMPCIYHGITQYTHMVWIAMPYAYGTYRMHMVVLLTQRCILTKSFRTLCLCHYYLPHFGPASDGWIIFNVLEPPDAVDILFFMKLLNKAEAITESDADEATPLSISKADKEAIDLILSQLLAKKAQLEEIDKSILKE